jgi:hypothetical protein
MWSTPTVPACRRTRSLLTLKRRSSKESELTAPTLFHHMHHAKPLLPPYLFRLLTNTPGSLAFKAIRLRHLAQLPSELLVSSHFWLHPILQGQAQVRYRYTQYIGECTCDLTLLCRWRTPLRSQSNSLVCLLSSNMRRSADQHVGELAKEVGLQ